MSRKYQELMERIAKAIENRTIITTATKTKLYEQGAYKPFFSLIERDGELICVWCSNVKAGDKKLSDRLQLKIGLPTSKDDPKGWDAVTLKVMHSLGLKL